jgi:hypothetical protein
MGTYGDLLKLSQSPRATSPDSSSLHKAPATVPQTVIQPEAEIVPADASQDNKQPRHHGTVIPRHQGIKTPRNHDTLIQTIRSAVKQFGKEAATHRFTPDEKKAVAEVVFAYRNRGIKTSENEIARTGVNFLIEDYKVNGEKSILDQVLKALNE